MLAPIHHALTCPPPPSLCPCSELKAKLAAKAAEQESPSDKGQSPVFIVSPALGVVGSGRSLGGGTAGSAGSGRSGFSGSKGSRGSSEGPHRGARSGATGARARGPGAAAHEARAARMDPALLSALAASHRSLSSRSLSPRARRRRRSAASAERGSAGSAAQSPPPRRRPGSAERARPRTENAVQRARKRASRRASLSASGKGAAARAFQQLAQDIEDMNDDMGRASRSIGRMRSSMQDTAALLLAVEQRPALQLLDQLLAKPLAQAQAQRGHVAPVHSSNGVIGAGAAARGVHGHDHSRVGGAGVKLTGTGVGLTTTAPHPRCAVPSGNSKAAQGQGTGATGFYAHHPPPHAPPGLDAPAAGAGVRSSS